MTNINLLAVLVAAVLAFILGGLWYSKGVFGTLWSKYNGSQDTKQKHPAAVFILSFIFYLLSALAFTMLLGPHASLSCAIGTSLTVGVLFVGMCFGINYLFGGRSIVLLFIDGGYHILQFLIYGLIFGLWH